MRLRRLYTWLLSSLLGLGLAVSAQAQSGKVGYLDMQRLLDNAPQVVAARKQLESEFRARDQQLKQEEARLAALKERETRERVATREREANASLASFDAETETRLRER